MIENWEYCFITLGAGMFIGALLTGVVLAVYIYTSDWYKPD